MEYLNHIHKKFRNRLLSYLLVSTLIPIIALLIVSYLLSLQSIHSHISHQIASAATDVAQKAEGWHQKNLNILKVIIKEFEDVRVDKSDKQRLLKNIVASNPWIYGITLMSQDGQVLVRSGPDSTDNLSDRQYFQEAMKGRFYSQGVMSKAFQKPALCTAGPISHKDKITEVVAMCSFIDVLAAEIGTIELGKTGYVFLLDDHSRVLAHPRLPFLSTLETIADYRPVQAFKEGVREKYNFQDDNKDYLSYVVPTGNNWLVVAMQEKSETLTFAQKNLTVPLLIALIFLLTGIILTYLVVEQSTKPIHDLANAVNELGRQNFKARVHVKTKDEFKLLAHNFNLMAARIEKHTNELNQKVAEQSQQLVYSAKMSSLGEMAGGIAHEINNPLAIISIHIQSLKQQLDRGNLPTARFHEILAKMEDTCLRINQIIKALRSFSRDGSQDPMRLENLSTILSDAEGLCSELLRKRGVELKIHCDPNLSLECQSVPLAQVFVNMIMNSKDAVSALEKKWISIQVTDANDNIFIRVIDSGIGIPVDIRDKMMQPFFTTKRVGEGTGLGLAISKGIIEQHKGKVWYNPDSYNTEFCIVLPKNQKAGEQKSLPDIVYL